VHFGPPTSVTYAVRRGTAASPSRPVRSGSPFRSPAVMWGPSGVSQAA
jgi:hypothetical protein